jgi:hypothetical protein
MPMPDATPPDSSHKLARVLVLDDGTKLVTLRDAANVLTERSDTVISWPGIELIEQLLRAPAAILGVSSGKLGRRTTGRGHCSNRRSAT